jgi:hypothetical protein
MVDSYLMYMEKYGKELSKDEPSEPIKDKEFEEV